MSLSSLQLSSQQLGDVNSSGMVDIVDALLIAQYYVGLNPAAFVAANADVNCSGSIDIVDALLVAQYYVGLISRLPGCTGTAVPTIAPTPVGTPYTTIGPTEIPTVTPQETPTAMPSPTPIPTTVPTPEPTAVPTAEPTVVPTPDETTGPTAFPEGTPNPSPSPITSPVPIGFGTPAPTAIPPAPGTLIGDCVMSPNVVTVTRGDGFAVSILCNTGSQKLGAYELYVYYDPTKVVVDTTKGINGVSAGSEGFVTTVDSTIDTTLGVLSISGADVSGKGPGAAIEICVVNFKAKNLGTFNVSHTVTKLADEKGTSFAAMRGFGITGTITDAAGFCDIKPSVREVPLEVDPVIKQTIVCNTGTQSLSSYEFDVTYDPALLALDTRLGITGAVTDTAGFSISVDASIGGKIKISGSSANAKGPGILSLCAIKFIALNAGASTMEIAVVKLDDGASAQIGSPHGFGADVRTYNYYVDLNRNQYPELIWTGENYGLFWLNYKTYISDTCPSGTTYERITPTFVTIDNQGNRIGDQVLLDQEQYASGKYDKNIIWNGNQYAYVWVCAPDSTYDSDHKSLMLETLDSSGAIKKRVALVENKAIDSRWQGLGITWTGDEYLVVWRVKSTNDNYEIYLTCIDASGNRLQGDVMIGARATINVAKYGTNNLSNFKAAFWTGSELKNLYFTNGDYPDMRKLYALTVDRYGKVISDTLFNIDPLNYILEAAIWNNGEYACLLFDTSTDPGHMQFARFDEAGNIIAIGKEPLVYCSEYSLNHFSVLPAGNGYAVNWGFWGSDDLGNAHPIKTYILNATGEILYRNENAKDMPHSTGYNTPDIVWTGTELGIVYDDARDVLTSEPTMAGIYFSRLDAQAVKIGTAVLAAGVIDNP